MMEDYNNILESLIIRYSSKGILIDTNLLLLYLVGKYDKNFIKQFKKTEQFSIEEFNFLDKFISKFRKVITTPHILAELSNFSFQIKEPKLKSYLGVLITVVREMEEKYISKDLITRNSLINRLEFTDLSIMEATLDKKCLVLTNDFKFAAYLEINKCEVMNFNHLRQYIIWSRN